MKNKKLNLPVLLKNTRVLSTTAAVLAAGLLTLPVQAESNIILVSTPNDISITESANTSLYFNDRQGADGSDWMWRHQGLIHNVVKCPSNSVKNCSAFLFAGIKFSVYPTVQNVFSVTPLNDFYDAEKKRITRFDIKNPNSFVKKNSKEVSMVLPNITLKPGEYAVASLIALDKWIPLGKGGMKKGVFILAGDKGAVAYDKIFNYDGKIGTWEGHAFRGHRLHVCVDKIGRVPNVNEEVTCNAPAKIPKGIVP
ncbi:MAG: hypothetical protein RI956_1018 [Pseudomonadota bacterium]|jgi:hypothetical protein